MKSRVGVWLMAGILGGGLLAAGCRNRSENVGGQKEGIKTAASAEKTNASYVVVNTVSRPDDKFDWPHRVEVHENYKLASGATVDISRFNGRIEIETAEGDEVDLYLVRSSREEDAFKQRKLIVEHSPERLALRMERANRSVMFQIFNEHDPERQRLILRLPRKIDLKIENVNAKVKVGEVDGEIAIESVGGEIELARASDGTTIEGVNGRVNAQVHGLKDQGLKIEGINGRVTLQIAGDLNADLDIDNVNGRIESELPNFKPSREPERGHIEGQIGKGGSPLEVSGINGRVWIGPVGKAPNMDQPGVVIAGPGGNTVTVQPGVTVQEKKAIKKLNSIGVATTKQ